MRTLLSILLLLLSFPLGVSGGFVISGRMGPPDLPLALSLSLCGQLALFFGGTLSGPHQGSIGLRQGLPIGVFLLGSLSLPITLFRIAHKHFAHVGNDEWGFPGWNMLSWSLVGGLSSLLLLVVSAKLWRLRERKSRVV